MAKAVRMRWMILCFAAGAAVLQWRPVLPVPAWYWCALPAALAFVLAMRPAHALARHTCAMLAAVLCLGAGFGWAAWRAGERLSDALPLAWEGADIRLVGVVAQMPQPNDRNLRFEFDVERVLTPQAAVPARIALSWWGSHAQDGNPGSIPQLRPGERWELTVRLRRPHGLHNPNGFDYEAWLLERNIRATGYVRAPAGARRLAAFVWKPQTLIERVREAVRARINEALPGAQYGGVLIALAIGEQRAIPPEQWQVFTRTGVNHLMSISGLHVTMIAGLAFWFVYGLWRLSPRLMLYLPARKAAAIAGLLAACLYAWLASFAVPAQRTVYMLAVVAAALWSGRLTAPGTVLCLALLAVVVLDPWAPISAGFWLSFGAVGVIMFVSAHRIGEPHWLASWARVQWAITLGLAPLLVALFQQLSLISPLANALAIPLISLAVVPLTLLGVIVPGTILLQWAHGLMAACGAVLSWLATHSAAVWQQHAPPAWAVGAALAGVAWMLLPRGFPARWIGACAMLPLFLVVPALLPEGALRIAVLDIGQGLAVVVQTRGHSLLYDTGTSYGPQADSGNRVIVPYLRAGGMSALDAMIVSHADKDHAGGVASVMAAVPVRRVLSSLETSEVAQAGWQNAERCIAGQRWRWDGVDFEMMHPTPAHYTLPNLRRNDRSCVLRVSAGGQSILLTADIEQKSERDLVQRFSGRLASQVLLVPHHGSRTSSSPGFLGQVNPRHVIVSAGYRNRFGHPKEDVLDRYRALGSRIYRTDLDGALLVSQAVDGRVDIRRQRALARRYWHAPLENPDLADDEEMPCSTC